MKLVLLTTETTHHTWFVHEVAKEYKVESVFCETWALKPPFETSHAFEEDRAEYERESLRKLAGREVALSDIAPVRVVERMNDRDAVAQLSELNADVAVVFGTGWLSPDVIAAAPNVFLNLHGGDPERYRGLDTHLWSLYHNEFDGLITTLHRLNGTLDDGQIVLQADIPLTSKMPLHELRLSNTKICVELTLAALDQVKRMGDVLSHTQIRKGRYYSFMPSVLKGVAKKHFDRYVEGLS
jgi:methionyl-tRNA formyltransferase